MPASEVTINVSGEFSQRVAPELCEVSFGVSHDSTDLREALDKVTRTTNKISSMLKDLAPHKADTSSAAVALDAEPPIVEGCPVTKWSTQKIHKYSSKEKVTDSTTQPAGDMAAMRTFSTTTTYRQETRHHVSTTMKATFHDFDKLEAFVAEIMREDTVNVHDLDWTVTQRTRSLFTAAVRSGAVKDAITKAADYAAALGDGKAQNLRVVEINDHSGGHPVAFKANMYAARADMGGGQQENVSFEPEPVVITSNVGVKIVV